MNAVELLAELDLSGVMLWEELGELHFRAPHGVMTDKLRERLREHKASLVAHLRQSPGPIAQGAPERRHEPFPLTDVQAAYLLGRGNLFTYGGVACHAYVEIAFGVLDPDRLEDSWNRIVQRHDMLRAVISPDGFQRVRPDVPPYRVAVTDTRGGGRAATEAAVAVTRSALDHAVRDPAQWPLFDLRVTLGDHGAVLHFSIDFLIADYVSIRLLLDDLRQRYHGTYGEEPPPAITFRDYHEAERRLRDSPRYHRDRRYWWDRIDTLPPAPALPSAVGGTAPRFRRLPLRIAPEEWAGLRRLAREHGVTGSVALLAAYADVLARWSSEPAFSIDVTLMQRLPLHPDIDRLVGDFTSINLLAVDPRPHTRFRDRARAVQDQLWCDLDHRMCSGVEVMRELARRRGPGAALFPLVFTSAVGLGPTAVGDSASEGWGEVVYGISQTPQVSLDCQVIEYREGLTVNWDVREGVFPAGLVDAMFTTFRDLVRRLTCDADAWATTEPFDLPADQRARRSEVNATAAFVEDRGLCDAFLAEAARAPERLAVACGSERVTYGELLARARAVAHHLGKLGARSGELVAVIADKSVTQIAAVLGCGLAGAAYLPIDTDQPEARRNRILADAGVRFVLVSSDPGQWLPETEVIDAVAAAAGPVPARAPLASLCDEVAYVIYTSGSTGTPKGVAITHRSAVNTIVDINRRFEVGADDRVLGVASLGFDLSVYDVFGVLGAGGALILPEPDRRHDPSHWAELVSAWRVTLWNSVPAQLQMLVEYIGSHNELRLPSLRLALVSGDWIPVGLPGAARARLPGLRMISLGGATEAAIWSICHPVDRVDPSWRSIPYGRPLANQRFHVLDAALRPCPDWVPGELYIGGAGLAVGYHRDPARTAERFIIHPVTGERLYQTGDLGRYLPDGEIEILGRIDHQIKLRGHRIELVEIDAVLASHPAVGDAATEVVGEGDERHLAAAVTPATIDGSQDDVPAEIERVGRAIAEDVRRGIDAPALIAFARQLDQTALTCMAHTLRRDGLFADPTRRHSMAEIVARLRVAPRHQRLLRRWLKALECHGMIRRTPETGELSDLAEVDEGAVEAAWRRVEAQQPPGGWRSELLDYFRTATLQLPALLAGEVDPLALLFPHGGVEIHEVAYRENVVSQYLNRLAAGAVQVIACAHAGRDPLRVLEIGAGVGGTSDDLIDALAAVGVPVEYVFTDVSPFFLARASQRYRDRPWVRFQRFDFNRDPGEQGLASNFAEIIVCANVLHYARDAKRVLDRLRQLAAPGGWLVAIETTRDNYQILTSMEFLFDATSGDFDDTRRGHDETFIARAEWLRLLRASGAHAVACLADGDDVLAHLGMHVFVAGWKRDRARIDRSDLVAHVAARLPGYMVPRTIEVVDALPRTTNGKLDRQGLRALLARTPPASTATPAVIDDEPATDLERRLAAVWAEALGRERVGRHQSLFELGGDSLVAAQLAARLREQVPEAAAIAFNSLLRTLLEGQTVGKLAERLAQPWSPTLSRTTPASSLRSLGQCPGFGPIIVVHDATGDLLHARELLAALGKQRPLGGLTVIDGDDLLASQPALAIERLAADHARAVIASGAGPVHLVGHGDGGLIAAEIARNLIEAGHPVPMLTVIGSVPPPWRVDDDLLATYLYARARGVNPTRLGYPPEAMLGLALDAITRDSPERIPAGRLAQLGGNPELESVAWCFRRLGERSRDQRLAALARACTTPGGPTDPVDVFAGHERFVHLLRAAVLHEPAAYGGDVTLLLPTSDDLLWRDRRDHARRYWEQIALGSVRVIDVPGTHHGCLAQPHVGEIAGIVLALPGTS